jgi:hypothetical protein
MPFRVEDFVAFSKILSAALVVCGFIILGLLLGRQLAAKGAPGWVVPALAALGALVGMSQGWAMIRPLWKDGGKKRP